MSKASNLAGFAGSISSNNNLSVGIVTASSFVGNVTGNLTGTSSTSTAAATAFGLSGSPNINVGVITASSFFGNGAGLTGVGIGTTGSVNTTGIITASTVTANEFIGTGDKLIFSPSITSFSPTDGATGVNISSNIVFTYDQTVTLGVGTITLRKDSSTGTIVESYVVGVSTRATLSNQTLTIDPTNNLDYSQEYYVVIPQGAVKNALVTNSGILTTYNFTTETAPTLSSVVPADESTNVGLTTNITFTFNKNITAGTGSITLRTVSASGTIVESYDVTSSPRLTFSSNTLTIDPTSSLNNNTVYYVVIPSGAVTGYTGINTYNFTAKPLGLGDPYEGGCLICQSGGIRWVAAPSSAEIGSNWCSRNTANTCAQQVSGCTGWFVPSVGQLQNPGFICSTYWGASYGQRYWSNTERDYSFACYVAFVYGDARFTSKGNFGLVRSFRCVTY